MEKIAEKFDKLKQSRTAHKGRVTSLFNRLNQLSKLESVRGDKLSNLMDDLDVQISKSLDFNQPMEDLLRESNLLSDEHGESTSFLADIGETKSQLLQQELEAEALCTSMKQNSLTQEHAQTSNSPIGMELYTDALVGVQTKLTELCTKTQTGVTPLKLTSLDPPSWDGQKANFYMWRDMFNHTMSQARMSDDQVQIAWLLRKGTMPLEYQTVIQDCKSMKSVWERLEEQIPASTVRHEIIQNFKQTPSLPPSSQRNASSMRQLANAISLFVRRMDDLGLKQDAMSTICFEQACNRLDQETALRYATYCRLGQPNGVVESMESLADFLRSEATTLERLGLSIRSPNNTVKSPKAHLNVLQQELKGTSLPTQYSSKKCILGCENAHRFVDCPIYMQKSVEDKRQFISGNQRCFICLGMHMAKNCNRKIEDGKCVACGGRQHHRTLCPFPVQKTSQTASLNPRVGEFKLEHVRPVNNDNKTSGSVATSKNIQDKVDYSPLLAVNVRSADGVWIRANCFLDMGSDTTLVRKQFVNNLGLPHLGSCTLKFGTAGGNVHEEVSQDFNLEIKPLESEECSYKIVASSVVKPCFDVSPIPSKVFTEYEYLTPYSNQIASYGGPVDLLIGRDYAPYIQTLHVLQAPSDPDKHPSIAFTKLGCYLFGGIVESPKPRFATMAKVNFLSKSEDQQLRNFFYGDILGVKPTKFCTCSDTEISETAFIKQVKATTTISDEGRVRIQMPWKPGFPEALPNNYDKAFAQMEKREKRLVRDGKLDEYNREIDNLVEREVVRILDPKEAAQAKKEKSWYLNHRIIERPDKSSTKLRVVFDSASPFQGICLNDALEKGPNFTNSLFRCLLTWREERVAITGDISRMFNQIEMSEADQRFHRFIWRYGNESCSPPFVFQWKRVLFGDTCSPDLAMFAIRMLADIKENTQPIGAKVLKENTYIDDVANSVPEPGEAERTISEVDSILAMGKFSIKVWNSNHSTVDKNPQENEVDFLGHLWNKLKDTFKEKPKTVVFPGPELSKRNVLGLVMKLWDPLGFLLPVTMKYRMDLQAIWEAGFKWDDPLSVEISDVWQKHVEEMNRLADVELDRCLKPLDAKGSPQLHAFSDAGDRGFGTCIFLRWETTDGVKLTFVASKAFVAPLKHKSTPKKELMGAIAMSRLVEEVVRALKYSFEVKRFWVDSKDSHDNVEEELRYVPSKLNPADDLTKPISVESLKLWHQGPDFLKQPESSWPKFDGELETESEILEKPKPKVKKYRRMKGVHAVQTDTGESENFGTRLAEKLSPWIDLLETVALGKILLRQKTFSFVEESFIDVVEELSSAKQVVIKLCQASLNKDLEKTRRQYFKHNIHVDPFGVIRSGGRLDQSNLPDELKHPVILPGGSQLVRLLAEHCHRRYKHQGYRVVIANLRMDGILIIGGRKLLKSVAARCFFCRIRRRKLLQQRMGELPSFRIQPKLALFSSVAMDFFGHLKVKQSRNVAVDGSVLIITCATTRCIHLELCLTLDTNSFLRAWRRFVTCRGVHPSLVFSDCGGAFVGAEEPIREWIEEWDKDLIKRSLAKDGTKFEWLYNVPTASHMNGVVESLINSVRKALDASVCNYTQTRFTYEQWATILSEVTHLINSRPFFPNGNPEDFNCITGNNLLHPYGQTFVLQTPDEERINPRDMLKTAEKQVTIFWDTWLRLIPPQLLFPNKWFRARDNLKEGDFVINLQPGLKGGTLRRGLWKKGIVCEVHPSQDNLVRSVTIRDSLGNLYKRPIHKLCLITTKEELECGLKG